MDCARIGHTSDRGGEGGCVALGQEAWRDAGRLSNRISNANFGNRTVKRIGFSRRDTEPYLRGPFSPYSARNESLFVMYNVHL